MDLYFSPLACSLATRITFYEANADANFIQVNTKKKRVADGTDFYPVSPLGQVPVLRTDEGWLLTENTAILPYVADQFPHARLMPPAGTAGRAKVQQWLGFISTELHKAVVVPLLDPGASEDVLNYTRKRVPLRLAVLDAHFAAQTEFGKPLVNSLFTLGLLIGMTVNDTTLGTTVANLGMTDVAFPKPVFAGDTLHVRTRVLSMRESKSRPDAGIVEFEHTALNHRDEVVAVCKRSALMRKRPA